MLVIYPPDSCQLGNFSVFQQWRIKASLFQINKINVPNNLSSKAEITKRKERKKWKSLNHESLTTLMADC